MVSDDATDNGDPDGKEDRDDDPDYPGPL